MLREIKKQLGITYLTVTLLSIRPVVCPARTFLQEIDVMKYTLIVKKNSVVFL